MKDSGHPVLEDLGEDQLGDLCRRFPHLEELVVGRSTAICALAYWRASDASEAAARVAEFEELVDTLTDELRTALEGLNVPNDHARREE